MTKGERTRLGILCGVFVLTLAVWVPNLGLEGLFLKKCDCLRVSFLDVGQGDSILIQTPDGYEALIDGGVNAAVLRELAEQRSFFDKSIDMVVATHPDADHIGGLVDVFKRYQVETILQTENINDTPVAAAFETATKNEEAEMIYAEAGQVIMLGTSTTLRILSPAGDERQWESNTASIVMRLEYGSSTFMLTGDAPSEIESYLVETYPEYLDSDVLKLGHHGSKTSTSQEFLDAVSPQYAVVSAGIDNRYGHPHQEVMQRVFGRKVQTFHTGTDGTIIFESDGKTVWKK